MANVTVSVPTSNITVDTTNSIVNVSSTTSNVTLSATAAVSNADVRTAISISNVSGFGNLAYDSTSASNGVIQYTGVSTSDIRGLTSATSPIIYNSSTGDISIDSSAVFSGKTTDDLAQGNVSLNRYLRTEAYGPSQLLLTNFIDITDGRSTTGITADTDGTVLAVQQPGMALNGNVGFNFSTLSSGLHDESTALGTSFTGQQNIYIGSGANFAKRQTWYRDGSGNLQKTATPSTVQSSVVDGINILNQKEPTFGTMAGLGLGFLNNAGASTQGATTDSAFLTFPATNMAGGANSIYHGSLSITNTGSATLAPRTDNPHIHLTTVGENESSSDASNLRVSIGTTSTDATNMLNVNGTSKFTGDMGVTGNINVTGNVEVDGNLNYRNVEDLYVRDQTITLNANATTNASVQIIGNRPQSTYNSILNWNESTDKWQFSNGDNTFKDMIDGAEAKTLLSTTTAAASGGGTLAYNDTSGVFTFAPADLSDKIALTDLSVTTATASGSGALAYNNTSGVFTFTPAEDIQSVNSVNTLTGVVQIGTNQVPEGDVVGYDITTSSSVSQKSTSSQFNLVRGMTFNADGTKMFVVGQESTAPSEDYVAEYALTTPFATSTASYTQRFSIESETTVGTGVTFNPAGTKMFISSTGTGNQGVFEYVLSTGFDVSTASYNSVFYDTSSQETSPSALTFNTDGTKMFVVGLIQDTVNSYTLTTGFDLSTVTTPIQGFDVGSQADAPKGLAFNNDGTQMFVADGDSFASTNKIYKYTLSSAFAMNTASYSGTSFDTGSQIAVGDTQGLAFNNNGTKMYVVDNNNGSGFIQEYALDEEGSGVGNLYYTQARFDTAFANKSTTDLSEGTNEYFTTARANTAITTKLNSGDAFDINTSGNVLISGTGGGSVQSLSVPNGELNLSNVRIASTTGATSADKSFTIISAQEYNSTINADSTAGDEYRANCDLVINASTGTQLGDHGASFAYFGEKSAASSIPGVTSPGWYYRNTSMSYLNPTVEDYKPMYTDALATANFNTNFATKDSDDLPEGTTNLYFTDARVRSNISVNTTSVNNNLGALAYDSGTGVISFTPPDPIAITGEFSVIQSAASSGGSLTYNNNTGDFTYAPADVDAGARAAISVTTAALNNNAGALAYDQATGVLTFTPAESVTNTTNIAITDDTSEDASHYLTFTNNTTGNNALEVSSSKLFFNPADGDLTVGNNITFAKGIVSTIQPASSTNFAIEEPFGSSNTLTDTMEVDGDGYALFGGNRLSATSYITYSGTADLKFFEFEGSTTSGDANITVSAIRQGDDDSAATVADLAVGYVLTGGTTIFDDDVYVTAIDTGTGNVTMSSTAIATETLTYASGNTFSPGLVDTDTGLVMSLQSTLQATGSGSYTTIATQRRRNIKYGYPQRGPQGTDFDVVAVGSGSEYSFADLSDFTVARTDLTPANTVIKANNGIVVGENTDLTNRGENDVFPSFGVNIMWDGLTDTGTEPVQPAMLFKSYTDNAAQSNAGNLGSGAPRMFFTTANGKSSDNAFDSYPRLNQELGRLTFWGSNGQLLNPSSYNVPAYMSVGAADNWDTWGGGVGGNTNVYFGATGNGVTADTYLSYKEGEVFIGSNSTNKKPITFLPAAQVTGTRPQEAYIGGDTRWAEINYADTSAPSGAKFTINNGGSVDAGTVGDMQMSLKRLDNSSNLTTDIESILDGTVLGLSNQPLVMLDSALSPGNTLDGIVATMSASGTFTTSSSGNESALGGNQYTLNYVFTSGSTGNHGYRLSTGGAAPISGGGSGTVVTYTTLGGSSPYINAGDFNTIQTTPSTVTTVVSSGVTAKEWTFDLEEQSEDLKITK